MARKEKRENKPAGQVDQVELGRRFPRRPVLQDPGRGAVNRENGVRAGRVAVGVRRRRDPPLETSRQQIQRSHGIRNHMTTQI